MEDNNKLEPFLPSMWIKRMILITALVIIIIGAIVYRSLAVFPFALGVLATSGLNILLYGMIERTVRKVLSMEDQVHGKNIVTLHSMLRFLITGAVLAIIGVIHSFTSPPPLYNPDRLYINIWASIFPGAPESLLTAPFISLWGALFGVFTLKLSLKLIGFLKLEKDGEHFVKYVDDDEEKKDSENGEDVDNFNENSVPDGDNASDSSTEAESK
ncbi:MAG: hypothetical protein FWE83_01075 [Oscillospiraceae bacterium]|nr:hypothetical protein [Oscillospiraceae bacterium]